MLVESQQLFWKSGMRKLNYSTQSSYELKRYFKKKTLM